MKRRATKTTKLDKEESRFSKHLFNKSEKLVQDLKSQQSDVVDGFNEKPAWVDEDDTNFGANIIPHVKSKALYVDKLKQKYETLMGTPNWAKLKKNVQKDDERIEDDGVLSKVRRRHKEPHNKGLKQNYLELRKISTLNHVTRNEGPLINCIEFHPKSTVALVAGQAGIVSLFSVGGDVNDKLHSFKLKNWDITSAHFAPNGKEAYISSACWRNFCYYDLIKAEPQLVQLPKNVKRADGFELSPDGKYFAVYDGFDEAFIISAESRELLKILKHNSTIASLTFGHDSKQLFSFGEQGEITIWDLATYKSVNKFYDNACVTASCITCSPCGRLLATGSGEGIVNIYETDKLNCTDPFPHKTISNLTTKITTLKFNPTTEILALASSTCENAAKMVHIPSYHVFMNFPRQDAILGRVCIMNFSPNGGFLGIGNNKACAPLYRLKHYKNY